MEDYYFFFNFIYYIFGCINEDDEKVKQCLPFIKTKFREIFLKNNKNMEIIVDKLMDLNNKNNKEEIKNENNINNNSNDNKKIGLGFFGRLMAPIFLTETEINKMKGK